MAAWRLAARGTLQAARAHASAEAPFQQSKHIVPTWQTGQISLEINFISFWGSTVLPRQLPKGHACFACTLSQNSAYNAEPVCFTAIAWQQSSPGFLDSWAHFSRHLRCHGHVSPGLCRTAHDKSHLASAGEEPGQASDHAQPVEPVCASAVDEPGQCGQHRQQAYAWTMSACKCP